MKNLNSNEAEAINKLKDILSKNYKFVQIKLFGSKARGDFNQESDIDLLIVLDNYNWGIELNIYEICFEVGLEYDVFFSPVIFSKAEIEGELIKSTPFCKIINREAVLL